MVLALDPDPPPLAPAGGRPIRLQAAAPGGRGDGVGIVGPVALESPPQTSTR